MRAALAVFFLLVVTTLAPCGSRVVVLCYNVQNLFDERADGTEYPEYRPPAWGRDSVETKLAAIGKAIRRAVGTGAPDVVALQEVENLEILLRLRDRYLAGLGYRYAVLVPQDGVATQVAVLSRLPVVRTAVHSVGRSAGLPLRHILEIEIEHRDCRLVVLNNHWKSKSGGVAATAEARRQAAAAVCRRVGELLRENPAADVLVVGDLNENLTELVEARGRYRPALLPWDSEPLSSVELPLSAEPGREILLCSDPEQVGAHLRGLGLYEPWYELPPEQQGSAVYQGRWQTPDHMLLAAGLFDRRGFSYRRGSFRVVRLRSLVHPETGYPLAFRRGGGASDHLPLLLELETH